jgi:hypothetical protein
MKRGNANENVTSNKQHINGKTLKKAATEQVTKAQNLDQICR